MGTQTQGPYKSLRDRDFFSLKKIIYTKYIVNLYGNTLNQGLGSSWDNMHSTTNTAIFFCKSTDLQFKYSNERNYDYVVQCCDLMNI